MRDQWCLLIENCVWSEDVYALIYVINKIYHDYELMSISVCHLHVLVVDFFLVQYDWPDVGDVYRVLCGHR